MLVPTVAERKALNAKRGEQVLTYGTGGSATHWALEDAMAAIGRPDEELKRIGKAAQERVLADHTSEIRAAELESILQSAWNKPAEVMEAV